MKSLYLSIIIMFLTAFIIFTGCQDESRTQDIAEIEALVETASEGSTIEIPAGTYSGIITDETNKIIVNKSLTIRGAGIGKTVIVDAGFWIIGEEGKSFRVTGITFENGSQTYGARSMIIITGTSRNFRVDHCEFISDTFMNSVEINGYTYGLIDHCQSVNSRVLIREAMSGDEPWKRPLTLGTANAVYIEDSSFYSDVWANAVDSNGGARYVFRYNDVSDSYCEVHGLQNNTQRGSFSYEIYNNTFRSVDNGKTNYFIVSIRGGTGVVYNNTITNQGGDAYDVIALYNDRDFRDEPGWGLCDGTNPVDGNNLGNGYPCRDQIGRSTDSNETTVHPQAFEPLYAWNNVMDGSLINLTISNGCETHIQEGRDFYNSAKPGYTPYIYPHPLNTED